MIAREATYRDPDDDSDLIDRPRELPFPPLTKRHILNCAYNSWWPKYRAFVPKTRMVPLTKPFVDYLQSDGIFLPTDTAPSEDEEDEDVAKEWRDVHKSIRDTIKELGGKVSPKLNWSAPKDATHMLGNTMTCYTPDDVYLLLKSSDFISFDLNHAFDDTIPSSASESDPEIPFTLILRKTFDMNPSLEFRCFVRQGILIAVSQRDMNYFEFLHTDSDVFLDLIRDFFDEKLKDTFEDKNFVFDCYITRKGSNGDKVWLVDINPWAQRTDPLLFSWMELLNMHVPEEEERSMEPIRLHFAVGGSGDDGGSATEDEDIGSRFGGVDEDDVEELFAPELRLVKQDDPEAYSFASPQYSAHKMPKDVVDAAANGNTNALRELSLEWQAALEQAQRADTEYESDET